MNNFIKDFSLSKEQKDSFFLYYRYLIEENEKINLTSITKEDEVFIKHFYDSLLNSKLSFFSNLKNICDIGSGAGFPSIPLKIMFPDLKVTIIEPIKKRTDFLNRLIKELNLEGVTIQNKRAEDDVLREEFDAVFIRAVSQTNILLELAIPYLRVNGYLVLMKGPSYQEELENSVKALEILKAEVIEAKEEILPLGMGSRYLVVIKKKNKTSEKYPRKFALIKKSPL